MSEIVTEGTPFTAADDCYHPAGDDPLHLETNWWCFNVPSRAIGGWLHAAYYPSRGTARVRIFIWDPSGASPETLAYYKCIEDAQLPPDPDLRDIRYPGGYALKMLEPLTRYHVSYDDPAADFAIGFTFTAAHPPHRFTPGEAPLLRNPHIDQLGHYVGELKLKGERIAIDCWSVRDRTWGPREGAHASSQKPAYVGGGTRVLHPGGPAWREIERERGRGRIQYIFGHADGEHGFLSFARPQDGDAHGRSPLNMGWLLRDGRFARVDKSQSWMKVWRDPRTGWTQHIEARLTDREGRVMEAEGTALSWMSETGSGANALMRWSFDGRTGWGEDQDGWRGDHFQRMLAALNAR